MGSRPRYCWLASSLHQVIIHNMSRLLQGAEDSPIWFPPLTFTSGPGCYIFLAPLSLSESPRQVWGTLLPGCVIWCLISGTQEPGALWMGVHCCHSPTLHGISQAHTFPSLIVHYKKVMCQAVGGEIYEVSELENLYFKIFLCHKRCWENTL